MTAFSLAAVGGLDWEGGIALPADLLVAVVFLGDGGDGGVHDSSSQPEHKMEGRLLLDVVIGEGASVCISDGVPSSCLPAKMSLC